MAGRIRSKECFFMGGSLGEILTHVFASALARCSQLVL
jgi:hypothetical protein